MPMKFHSWFVRHRLAFKSGPELAEKQVDDKGRDEECCHAAEEMAVPEHDEIPKGSHRAEPAFLGHPPDEEAYAESWRGCCGSARSGLGKED